jgi:F1F0 ATPase subunit 2
MVMNEPLTLALVGVCGAALGAFFFGGLWWTVRRGVSSRHPALWFLGSTLVRTSAILLGFYLASAGHWERLLLCLLGFVVARPIVTWVSRWPGPGRSPRDAPHAP